MDTVFPKGEPKRRPFKIEDGKAYGPGVADMKAGLVIIDEVGFETFTREEANLFFRLVSYRYQRGSLCITSNKAIKDWPEMLAGDEVITTAILDRLLHSCQVLNIRGRSYRLRDLEDDLNGRP